MVSQCIFQVTDEWIFPILQDVESPCLFFSPQSGGTVQFALSRRPVLFKKLTSFYNGQKKTELFQDTTSQVSLLFAIFIALQLGQSTCVCVEVPTTSTASLLPREGNWISNAFCSPLSQKAKHISHSDFIFCAPSWDQHHLNLECKDKD